MWIWTTMISEGRKFSYPSLKKQTDGLGLGMERNIQPVFAKDINLDNNVFTLKESQAAVAPKQKW